MHDTVELIFQPGFSTAEQVTNLSGRGVGMDVVKTNIGRIGGSVEVATKPGKGTTYTLKIPLTLAIIPALLVTSGAQRYAIPQVNLVELVRATPEQIEQVHGAPVLPAARPAAARSSTWRASWAARSPRPRRTTSSCCRPTTAASGSWSMPSTDSAEIVVKPVGTYLKGVDTFAGATILGDGSGRADPRRPRARAARPRAHEGAGARAGASSTTTTTRPTTAGASLLVFSDHEGGRMAIPLELVTRLEEFPRTRARGRRAVPRRAVRRGDPAPRRHLAADAGSAPHVAHRRAVHGRRRPLPVIVYLHEGRRVGVVVGADPRRRASRPRRAAARHPPRRGRHDDHRRTA